MNEHQCTHTRPNATKPAHSVAMWWAGPVVTFLQLAVYLLGPLVAGVGTGVAIDAGLQLRSLRRSR